MWFDIKWSTGWFCTNDIFEIIFAGTKFAKMNLRRILKSNRDIAFLDFLINFKKRQFVIYEMSLPKNPLDSPFSQEEVWNDSSIGLESGWNWVSLRLLLLFQSWPPDFGTKFWYKSSYDTGWKLDPGHFRVDPNLLR